MRSKSLLSLLVITAITLSLGCGGGGGGGGTTTPATTYSVSGSVEIPNSVADGWNGSVRGAATISSLGLTAQAIGKAGNSLSEAVNVANDGTFTLTVTPDNDAIVKVSNGKGFDFRFHLGVFAANRSNVVVNASSTARAFLNWKNSWKVDLGDNDQQLANIVASITAALQAAPTGTSFEDRIVAAAEAARTALVVYQGYYDSIAASNTALENVFKAAKDISDKTTRDAKIDETKNYFSTALNSTQHISGYGLEGFLSATKSRYDRYTVNSYSFAIQEIRFTSQTTASATVSLYISVAPKSGDGLSGSFGPVSKVIGWKNESGNWKVWQDFPYLREQFGF
ncbi:MAG TPA: hypothetical protein VIV61_09290 [Candidatus Ozemobacteraceae bacterium]